MLKRKLHRHALAFVTTLLASGALYFAARADATLAIWALLGLLVVAALFVLDTR